MGSVELPGPPRAARPPRPARAPRPRRTIRRRALPYLLIAPTVLALAAVLGYPLVDLVVLSFQDMTRRELFSGATPPWAGLAHYRSILSDGFFWTVVGRTALFTVACVAATMALSLLVALLMRRVSPWVRTVMTGVLVAVWAMPVMVAASIFRWLSDADYGVVNWLLGLLPGLDFSKHNWFENPWQGFAVITGVVVWGAVPFAALTLQAALSQVPAELEEAALVDGARPRQLFRHVTWPVIKPSAVLVTSLCAIWDFGVFNQIWLMRGGQPEKDYYLLGVYSFIESFAVNRYSAGAAIAVLTVLMLLGGAVVYVRQLVHLGAAE
ncbi:carbohydrate ABC transporter permease [Streptomyces noursei]|uniref:carbohydrate ABC transporter permease n=1 Tax=Streptomyces noursei TaxID=1971 RepID=UPI001677C291|nr:sugar ABC transporter permease [Streptomyces noursei]MCZ1020221.1 sugar ABC transporter permease [Streptomyces noursei]GGX52349.1 sugar ABC transporter permease [Streptomyces noursei]